MLCIIDSRADIKILKNIENMGFDILLMPPNKNVSLSCQSHPDISLFRISENELIYSRDCDERFLSALQKKGIKLIEGNSKLFPKYPDDIKYNALKIGNYLVHKLNNTDSMILDECEKRNIRCLNVRQGYSCCSCAVVRHDLAITSDRGIYNVLRNTGEIKVLNIPPQKSIKLSGTDYGFFGGASGRIDDHNFAIAGKAEYLESYDDVKLFLEENNVKIINLTDEEPFDLGTIMFFTL